MSSKTLILISGILGLLAVSFGAFGAHILKTKISADQLGVFQTGVQYHFTHTLVILFVAFLNDKRFFKSAAFMVIGIILFSFSLYIYSLTQIKIFAIITPLGGLSFLIGWFIIIIEGVRTKV